MNPAALTLDRTLSRIDVTVAGANILIPAVAPKKTAVDK